jgi:hypothetical protein
MTGQLAADSGLARAGQADQGDAAAGQDSEAVDYPRIWRTAINWSGTSL